MKLRQDKIQRLLCERLCGDVFLETRPDGALLVRTPFKFPDGDEFSIHLLEGCAKSLTLSDQGNTLIHISYEHDVDRFLEGSRRVVLDQIVAESGIRWERGTFCMDTEPESLSDAVFSFGQALTRIYDLTLLSRTTVRSTFYDDLNTILVRLVEKSQIKQDYEPDVPNSRAYQVDYCVDGRDESPLFIFGVHNGNKARLTTIKLSYFLRNQLSFESFIVFKDQTEIPKWDLARLTDVSGDMISSLDSKTDFKRKLVSKVATLQ